MRAFPWEIAAADLRRVRAADVRELAFANQSPEVIGGVAGFGGGVLKRERFVRRCNERRFEVGEERIAQLGAVDHGVHAAEFVAPSAPAFAERREVCEWADVFIA